MRRNIGLAVTAITAFGVACSLNSVDRGNRITVLIDGSEGGRSESIREEQEPSAFLTASPAPSSLSEFDCIGVNVVGPGIPDTSHNPEPNLGAIFDQLLSQQSYCSYRGILAGPVTVSASTPQEITLVIPPGSPRLVQIVGFKERNGSNDCTTEFAGLPDPSPTVGISVEADVYEIGRAVVNLFQDQTISVSPDWNNLTAAQRSLRSLKCHTGASPSPSASPFGAFTVGPAMSVARGDPAVYYDTRLAPERIWVAGGLSASVRALLLSGPPTWGADTTMTVTAGGGATLAPGTGNYIMRVGGLGSPTTYSAYNGSVWGSASAMGAESYAFSASVYHAPTAATYFYGGIDGIGGYSAGYGKVLEGGSVAVATGTLPYSFARGHATVFTAGLNTGKILLAGGYDGTNTLSTCKIITPPSTVVACPAPLPTPRQDGVMLASSTGGMYLLGGAIDSGSVTPAATLYLSDPGATTWTPLAGMVTARSQFKAFSIYGGTKIIAIGGKTGPNLSDVTATTEIYDIATNTWAAGPSLVTGRYAYGAALASDGKIYIFGGYNSSGSELSSVEIFTP